jgi:hypothetical protein
MGTFDLKKPPNLRYACNMEVSVLWEIFDLKFAKSFNKQYGGKCT